MSQALTLSDILQIENCKEILDFQCPDTGIPIWTTIRVSFFRFVIGDVFYGVPIGGTGESKLRAKFARAWSIACAFRHNLLQLNKLAPRYPVMVMATGARLIRQESLYFNTLSDYFVGSAPEQTLAIEDLFGSQWPFPRQHQTVLIHTPLRVQGVFIGRTRLGDFRSPACQLVDLVSQRAKIIVGWDIGEKRRQWLKRACANSTASLLPRYRKYQSLFRRTGTQLLVKEEACYGGADNATAILAARNLGIVTAEYQHGAISKGHDAYNYADAVSSNAEYRKILPDYFLTYGSWWGEQINAPVNKISLGNPHRAEVLNLFQPQIDRGRQILVLGDGIETDSYLGFCKDLAAALGITARVAFRPHPLERRHVWEKHPNGLVGGFRIDKNQDIYSSFRESGAVVSEISTGLFEAIGLVPKVFIWDTPKARFSFPIHPFQSFSDASNLARLLLERHTGLVDAQQLASIWAPNWQQNYLDFIERAVRR